jgi:ferredoxin
MVTGGKPMKVIVDRERCVSSGNCADLVPLVFTQDGTTGIVELLDEHPDEALREAVRNAARVCPALAITIEE